MIGTFSGGDPVETLLLHKHNLKAVAKVLKQIYKVGGGRVGRVRVPKRPHGVVTVLASLQPALRLLVLGFRAAEVLAMNAVLAGDEVKEAKPEVSTHDGLVEDIAIVFSTRSNAR